MFPVRLVQIRAQTLLRKPLSLFVSLPLDQKENFHRFFAYDLMFHNLPNFIESCSVGLHVIEMSAQLMKNSGGSPGELLVTQNQRRTQRSQVVFAGRSTSK